MNSATYTGDEVRHRFPAARNLGELIKFVEDDFHQKGQVICQVWINGASLTEADESQLKMKDISEIASLQVDSETPDRLLSGLLNNWVYELPKLIEANDALAQAIRFEGLEGRYKDFVDLIESCQFLIDSLLSLQKIVSVPEVLAAQWIKNSHSTAQAIHDCLNAFERKDFVLLAELMEYDLGNSLQEWLNVLEELRKEYPSTDRTESTS